MTERAILIGLVCLAAVLVLAVLGFLLPDEYGADDWDRPSGGG